MIQQIKTSIKSKLLIATLHYHNTVHTHAEKFSKKFKMEKNFNFKIPEVKSSEKRSGSKTEALKGQREDRTDSGFFSESLTPKLPPEVTTDAFTASTEASEVREGPTTSRKKFEDIPVFESDSETEEHQSSEKVILLT